MKTTTMFTKAEYGLPERRRADHSQIMRRAAFSLIEIIIVVGLLTVIMLGLMMMFNQTQRVFQAGLTQVDVMESGRALTALMAREMEQITPSYQSGSVNFFAQIPPFAPLTMPLPGTTGSQRTNVMEEAFFLTKENQTWTAIGYRVSTPDQGVGTLYRFSTNSNTRNPEELFTAYNNTALNDMSPVADGVMHFRVRAYDTNGIAITGSYSQNIGAYLSGFAAGEVGFYGFTNNAVPASVEIELGILENRAYDRSQALPIGAARQRYLTNQAARVHIFRQLVPVRNVDPSAYQ